MLHHQTCTVIIHVTFSSHQHHQEGYVKGSGTMKYIPQTAQMHATSLTITLTWSIKPPTYFFITTTIGLTSSKYLHALDCPLHANSLVSCAVPVSALTFVKDGWFFPLHVQRSTLKCRMHGKHHLMRTITATRYHRKAGRNPYWVSLSHWQATLPTDK